MIHPFGTLTSKNIFFVTRATYHVFTSSIRLKLCQRERVNFHVSSSRLWTLKTSLIDGIQDAYVCRNFFQENFREKLCVHKKNSSNYQYPPKTCSRHGLSIKASRAAVQKHILNYLIRKEILFQDRV